VSREEAIEVEGRIVEVLPNTTFRVELANGHRLLAHVSGKTRLNFVRIGAGDMVKVKMSPYDMSKGSIALREDKLT
jgi:translation initiation factor IF-1